MAKIKLTHEKDLQPRMPTNKENQTKPSHQKLLEKMMGESHHALVQRMPNWGTRETGLGQTRTMDAFFEHVLPHLDSIDDLKSFEQNYKERRPSL